MEILTQKQSTFPTGRLSQRHGKITGLTQEKNKFKQMWPRDKQAGRKSPKAKPEEEEMKGEKIEAKVNSL